MPEALALAMTLVMIIKMAMVKAMAMALAIAGDAVAMHMAGDLALERPLKEVALVVEMEMALVMQITIPLAEALVVEVEMAMVLAIVKDTFRSL
jgi:hypothetical protein